MTCKVEKYNKGSDSIKRIVPVGEELFVKRGCVLPGENVK